MHSVDRTQTASIKKRVRCPLLAATWLAALDTKTLAKQRHCLPISRLPNSFSCNVLRNYSEAKLKSIDGTVSSRFKWFSNGYEMWYIYIYIKKIGTLQGVSLQRLRTRKHRHRALGTAELYSRLRRRRRGRRLKARSTLHQSRRDGNKETQFPHIRVRTAAGVSIFYFFCWLYKVF